MKVPHQGSGERCSPHQRRLRAAGSGRFAAGLKIEPGCNFRTYSKTLGHGAVQAQPGASPLLATFRRGNRNEWDAKTRTARFGRVGSVIGWITLPVGGLNKLVLHALDQPIEQARLRREEHLQACGERGGRDRVGQGAQWFAGFGVENRE